MSNLISKICITLALAAVYEVNADALSDNLDEYLKDVYASSNTPALAVGVIDNGKELYSSGFGITELNTEVSKNTRFRVASISKLFTATATMQLVEKGRINLNDQVSKYLPIYEGKDIKIIELLTHTSGLRDRVKPSIKADSLDQYHVLTSKKNRRLKKEFLYADVNYNILGKIVSKTSGISYQDYINQHIFKPLKLKSSGFHSAQINFPPDVHPYINGKSPRKAPERPFDPAYYPSEGLISSASDLTRWLQSVLSNNSGILTSAVNMGMQNPVSPTSWGDIEMGLGWQIYTNEYGKVIQHAGAFKGVSCLLIAYPEIGRGFVILSNADSLPRWEIADGINAILSSSTEG